MPDFDGNEVKANKNGRLKKKIRFSKPIFLPKFQGLVPGWFFENLSFFKSAILIFFASTRLKLDTNYGVE